MPNVTIENEALPDTHAYARFMRRAQGVFIDAIVFMVIIAAALIAAVSFGSDNVGRILGITVVASWLLYEPVLVSMTGGTIGHHVYNMRVVDDRGGNVSFIKAVVRMIIKSVLGWYSFIAMAATSRHQAVHDLVTKSTVQIRNLATAKPHHFSGKDEAFAAPGMPSRRRRMLLILAFVTCWFAVCWLALVGLVSAGLISVRCINTDFCSASETMWIDGVGLAWLGVTALIVFLGWRGRLWGGRAQRQPI